jgi:hypothetical protein
LQEACERHGHIVWVLELKHVICPWQDERLRLRQPVEQSLVPLNQTRPVGVALATQHREHGLLDASRVITAELPLSNRRELATKKGIGVRDGLFDRSRGNFLDDGRYSCRMPPS